MDLRILKAYKFEKLFIYDQNADGITNFNRFGWLLRSLTNIRFSPCEGQHRWWCFSSFIQGLPFATNDLPLQRVSYHQYPDEYQNFQKWQIHHERNIVILNPTEYTLQSLAQCKRHSDESRHAQAQGVNFCVFTFLSQFFTKAGSDWDSNNCHNVVFNNYWDKKVEIEKTQFTKNFEQVWNLFVDFVDRNMQFQATDLIKSTAEWNTIKEVAKKSLSFIQFKFVHSGGWTKGMLLIYSLVRAFCDNKESMFIFPSINGKDAWDDQRNPDQKNWIHKFRNVDFLCSIRDSVVSAFYYLELRSWAEQELVTVFRDNYQHFRPFLRTGNEVPAYAFVMDGKNLFQIPSYTDRFKRCNVFSGSTSTVLRKLLDSLCCMIYQDMFRAIDTYGFDPKVFADEDVTGLLEYDPHQVFHPSKDDVITDAMRTNYCLKMFLNWRKENGKMMEPFSFAQIDTTQPGAKRPPTIGKTSRETKGLSKPVDSKGITYSIEILLLLYPYYVKVNHEPFMRKLRFLQPYLGFYSSASKKKEQDGKRCILQRCRI